MADASRAISHQKCIPSARHEDDSRELQAEMIDRFGLLPDPVKHLFAVTQLKLVATALGIKKLVTSSQDFDTGQK